MRYGICPLSLVPVYDTREGERLLTQLLYGELIKILESRKTHCRIRVQLDGTEGWIRNDQYMELHEERYKTLCETALSGCVLDLIGHTSAQDGLLIPLLLGSNAGHAGEMQHHYEGETFGEAPEGDQRVRTALLLLNSPEMQGGRSPFGLDAPGLVQLVYKCSGRSLKRTAAEQALQGTPLSFIEESRPGDLAFFDGPDGLINHVGIIMKNNYIVHVHGKVRVDRLDHSGIFNAEQRQYTHPLRVIKQLP